MNRAIPKRAATTRINPEAAKLEALGWRAWYTAIFGQSFVDALAPHHVQAIEWHWAARRNLIMRIVVTFLAYFSIWARGNMKTTVARRIIICDACLSTTAGLGGYALIVGGTKKKVRGSANSIETLLSSPSVKRYYPALSEVKRNKQGASKGWTADFINTAAGYVFHFIGLDEGVAGANFDDIRPTLIVPDDIDDREDSPVIAESRFQTFTRAVLPTRQSNTLVFFAQNLISRFSVMYRIWKQQARVLTNRLLTDPIPAVRNLVTTTQTVHGIVKDVVVSGDPTWQGWDLQRIQEEIDTYGLPAFLRECQHEVEQSKEGQVLQHYDDSVHVICKSEFEQMFGTREIPQYWTKYVFNDWARTKTKYHANVAGIIGVSSQNSALPGAVFLFEPMSFPAATAPEEVATRILTAIAPSVQVGGREFGWGDLVTSTLQKSELEHFASNMTELIQQRRSILADVLPKYVNPLVQSQNYLYWRMSHERKDVCRVYNEVFGLPFYGINPGRDGGVDSLNLLMRVDYDKRHPFREGKKGYTNFFVVVEDGDDGSVPAYRESLSPDELHDADLLRYQLRNWRYRDPHLTVAGEREGELLKMNDDFGNGLMMIFFDGVISATPLTKEEIRIARLPDELKPASVRSKIGTPEFVETYWAQQHAISELKKQEAHEEGEAAKEWARFMPRPVQHRRRR